MSVTHLIHGHNRGLSNNNRTIASLVLSSQIVTRNEDSSTSVTQSLRENAMLQFKLLKVFPLGI